MFERKCAYFERIMGVFSVFVFVGVVGVIIVIVVVVVVVVIYLVERELVRRFAATYRLHLCSMTHR